MAVALQGPYSQFFNDSGIPLSGGLIDTWIAGTTTPLATYTDASGTTQAPNPIILDAAGRPASGNGVIWTSGTYDFRVRSADGSYSKTSYGITALNAGGDMTKAVYDPANIAQQLVGINATQTLINKTLTTPTIMGTTIANNAIAGAVGEVISSTVLVGAAVALTNTVPANVTSISLTAGDWDVSGNVATVPVGATWSNTYAGVSTTSATFPTVGNPGISGIVAAGSGSAGMYLPTGIMRVNVSTTTTVYLVAQSAFSGSISAAGTISARRVR